MEQRLEEDRSLKFSPSKLGVYKNCPRRYQYRYVDKISRARKTPETVVGVAVHSAFEELYELVSGGKTPSAQDIQSVYAREFDAGWDQSVLAKDDRFSKDDWRKVGSDCVELYHRTQSPFSQDRTVAVEKRVGFPIAVDGHEYRIEGFIDRLALAPDGTFEIVDYKTAKSLPAQEDVDADWQLALYEIAVRREWPDAKAVRLKWHYVRHGKTLISERDEAARERLHADVAALIGTIKHDHAFEPRPGPLCDWCEYRDLCPVFAHPVKINALAPTERLKDDGVRLVGDLADLEARRKRLRDELKSLDQERDDIELRLVRWAEDAGVTTVAGVGASAAITVKDDMHLPTKTGDPQRYAELEAELRGSVLWKDVARLDAHALLEGLRAGRWSEQARLFAETVVERYGRRTTTRAARLKRRADFDEE
ncbi:MAG: PD-(D/E)XK nuclease family protein [Elusimicrobiota bacterium]